MTVRSASLVVGLMISLAVQAQHPYGYPRLMQGPMVGPPTPDSITIWGRTSGEFECFFRYSEHPDMRDAQTSERVSAKKADDYTVTMRATGLKPDTAYYYQVFCRDRPAADTAGMPPFKTKTAPAGNAVGRFRVAFGSCARLDEDALQPIWRVVEQLEPDLFFWVGDNVYGDTLDPDIIAEEYRHQRLIPAFQPTMRSVPQFAIWDDHDYGLNNHDRRNPIKEGALRAFKRYWPNPSYGLPGTPGIFFKYAYGGVDFFFLDGRYHRSPNAEPDSPRKSMLGAEQREWLKRELKSSRAPFKVLICGSPWNESYGPAGDSWSAFRHERDGLFDFIRDENITGVVLAAGDTHWGELNCMPRSEHGGYDLYEFVSSPLAQHTWGTAYQYVPDLRIRPVVTEGSNVGIIDFDLSANPPAVTYSVYTHYGHSAWTPLTLSTDDLRNGVRSWDKKISPDAKKANAWGKAGKAATE